MRHRIYLAGPDVFLPDAIAAGEQKKKLTEAYGFEGVYPLDNELDIASLSPEHAGLTISKANEVLIKSCQLLIANITPFRGPSADVGTVYEIGFARALGLTIFAYTNTTQQFTQRTCNHLGLTASKVSAPLSDPNGMSIEQFNLIDNLMIDGGIIASGGKIIAVNVPENEMYTNIVGFEECLKEIVELMKR